MCCEDPVKSGIPSPLADSSTVPSSPVAEKPKETGLAVRGGQRVHRDQGSAGLKMQATALQPLHALHAPQEAASSPDFQPSRGSPMKAAQGFYVTLASPQSALFPEREAYESM